MQKINPDRTETENGSRKWIGIKQKIANFNHSKKAIQVK